MAEAMDTDAERTEPRKKRLTLEQLPPECLLHIFAELSATTSHRERQNDLTAISRVSRALRSPAQTTLFSQAFIRAEGRASLLKRSLSDSKELANATTSLAWTFWTGSASPAVLAALIRLASPNTLTIGNGFFEQDSEDVLELGEALSGLHALRAFAFGAYDQDRDFDKSTSSDYISHHLVEWKHLKRLDLDRVSFCRSYWSFRDRQKNTFWETYAAPEMQLEHLGITFGLVSGPPKLNNPWGSTERSWLHWLLANSASSLRSIAFDRLMMDIPLDALAILEAAAPRLHSVSLTSTSNPAALATTLCRGAQALVSLTLGDGDGPSWTELQEPVATNTLLHHRLKLQYLELQSIRLLEQLDVQGALEAGHLPSLRYIVLTRASRVLTVVQQLHKYCEKHGIDLTVKR